MQIAVYQINKCYQHSLDHANKKREKEGRVDPTLPLDPLNDPDWEDIGHPNAKAAGHHDLRNRNTGEIIRYDEAKPGKTGHKGHEHFHRPNPNTTEKHDEYLDEKNNPVPDGHDNSHLYRPDQVWWKT